MINAIKQNNIEMVKLLLIVYAKQYNYNNVYFSLIFYDVDLYFFNEILIQVLYEILVFLFEMRFNRNLWMMLFITFYHEIWF